MRIGIVNRLHRITNGQTLRAALPIHPVIGTSNDIEMTHFMNQGTRLGIRTHSRSRPEGIAHGNIVGWIRIHVGVIALSALATDHHVVVVEGIQNQIIVIGQLI